MAPIATSALSAKRDRHHHARPAGILNALHLDAHKELSRAFDAYASIRAARRDRPGSGDRAFCWAPIPSLAVTGDYEYPRGGFAGITKRFICGSR
jgi:hypothetical protein